MGCGIRTNENMRIAFPMLGLGRSGGVKVVLRLAEASAHRGHDVSLLVPRHYKTPPSGTTAEIVRVPPFPVPHVQFLVPTIMAAISFPYAKALRGFDVIVANAGPTCLATRLVDGARVKRYYLVQHDETILFSRLALEHWVTRLSYTAFEEGRIFVVSRWLQNMIRERSGCGSVVIPPGIDHEVFYPRRSVPHSGKQVLILSRGDGWRGLGVFLDAMELVQREVKDVKIVAAGHSGKPLKTSCPVEYIHPSDDELAELYSSSDVFVLPSFLEGMPVPPLEAMACGGAVVLTDCLGTRDYAVNGENCLVVPTKDIGSLAEAILSVVADDSLAKKLRMNGPATASSWTYERMGSIFVNALESE
jgi:glycosyltransferase involved in cell wall biosynthesis